MQSLSFNKKKIPLVSSVERDLSANYRRKVFDLLKERESTARAKRPKKGQRNFREGWIAAFRNAFSGVGGFLKGCIGLGEDGLSPKSVVPKCNIIVIKATLFQNNNNRRGAFAAHPALDRTHGTVVKPKIEAVIFDMDGLMFNTEDIYNVVGDTILKPRGHKFTLELKLLMMGLPGTKAFQVMVDHCKLDDTPEALESECAALFAELLPREIQTMPGLMELLERLEQLEIPKAVATSSHLKFANIALNQFDLKPRFRFVLTAESVVNGKPNPDVYLLAAKRMELDPSQLLVLEDSVTGSRAGVAAGATVIAVPTQYSIGCDFSHVDHVAQSLEDPVISKTIGG